MSEKRSSNHKSASKNKKPLSTTAQKMRRTSSKKAVKSFNPSLFIKKVEETVPTQAYTPKHQFTDFALEQQIKDNIAARGYINPTPIQDQTIPVLLEGRDVIGSANTGTGKTAAFLIPLVNRVLTKKAHKVLIVAPTRELAAQIQSELALFKTKTDMRSSLCIGGVSINPQIDHLQTNPAFIIGTPGRLLDLEKQRHLNFKAFDTIVLDEVDTMLDMGFIHDITYIINKLPARKHALFFSATIPDALKKIMGSFLYNPVSVSVKTRQSAENVNQDIVKVTAANKLETLHDLLIKPEFTRVIIFARTKWAVDKLAKQLKERGFLVSAMHGDKTQAQRKRALDLFKNNGVKILLATDVVARGIDIDDVSHVINYDLPQSHEDYIHRIGRTGRAQKVGQALTFIEL